MSLAPPTNKQKKTPSGSVCTRSVRMLLQAGVGAAAPQRDHKITLSHRKEKILRNHPCCCLITAHTHTQTHTHTQRHTHTHTYTQTHTHRWEVSLVFCFCFSSEWSAETLSISERKPKHKHKNKTATATFSSEFKFFLAGVSRETGRISKTKTTHRYLGEQSFYAFFICFFNVRNWCN